MIRHQAEREHAQLEPVDRPPKPRQERAPVVPVEIYPPPLDAPRRHVPDAVGWEDRARQPRHRPTLRPSDCREPPVWTRRHTIVAPRTWPLRTFGGQSPVTSRADVASLDTLVRGGGSGRRSRGDLAETTRLASSHGRYRPAGHELERSYEEVRERMSDPAVYNDHREAAEVGRRLKELEARTSSARSGGRRAPTSASRADPELARSRPTSSRTWRGSRRSSSWRSSSATRPTTRT